MDQVTVGQFLLDAFWNNAPLLEGFNKWGGVLMAIIGAGLAVPHVIRHGYGRFLDAAKRNWDELKKLYLWITRKHRSANVQLGGAGTTRATMGTPSVFVSNPWPADGTADEKHKWIREELQRLEQRFEGFIQNNENVIRHLQGISEETRTALIALQSELKAKEQESVVIDSIGLLPIMSGIVLTGVPEELSKLGAFGWLLFGLGCFITIYAIRRSKKSGVWSDKLS
ncbi:hypothetical protein [Arthrobacter sp. NicSoilC5]|uniref:hypothetical protein n=1 Tax=Arthrobacter sp. NicSoilC5 TaxID=2831000 RepID=UPI001CC6DE31|nr:hypothetical protein [Arthrobacter sp. NicSoilC5]BCW78313.1 hypothetical protein NicSoilC5_03320 [Arthrobacter sp. NicSoilC5]